MIEKIGFSLQQLPSCNTSQAHVGLLGPFLTHFPSRDSSLMLKLLLDTWIGRVLSKLSRVRHRALQR